MSNRILLNPSVKNSVLRVMEASKPLREDSGINFFAFIKQYDNGSFCDVISHEEWSQHFYDNYLNNIMATNKRLKQGINYWKHNSDEIISEIFEDGRNNFDIDARIEFIFRDEQNKCFNMYSFCAPKKFADKAYNFYDFHRAQLLKFITYFNTSAKDVITECDKPENRILIPKYQSISQDITNARRNYSSELKEEGASLKLSDREFETMLLYAGGASAKQIAYMFDKSPKTVETHMQNLRDKTGHADRLSMRRYVIDNGWDDLIKFFFPYTQPEAA